MIPWEKQQERDKDWYKADINKNIALHLNCDYFTHLYGKYLTFLHGKKFSNVLEIGISNTGGYLSIIPGIKRRIGLDIAVDYLRSIDMLPLSSKIKYINANAEDMPFGDKYFDLVIISNALDHVKDMEAVVKEIYRILRDDGIVLFGTFLRVKKPHPWTFQSSEEARKMFDKLVAWDHYEIVDNRPYFRRNNLYLAILGKGGREKELSFSNLI